MRIFGGGTGGMGGTFGWRLVSNVEELRQRLRHYVAWRDAVDADYTIIDEDKTRRSVHKEPGKKTGE